jgi:putative transposase
MPWTKPYQPARNQRLAPELYRQVSHIVFITIGAYREQIPFVSHTFNQIIIDTLREEQEHQGCTVFTYCLMPDHLHYLVSPRQDGSSVLTFTEQYKGKTTNRSWTHGWQGRLWQPRYYDHIVRAEEDLRAIAEYVLNNPVRKGLAVRPEDWPWGGNLTPLPL